MSANEALLIIDPKNSTLTKQILEDKYKDLMQRNSELNMGSAYLRSKIHNAYEILKKDYN